MMFVCAHRKKFGTVASRLKYFLCAQRLELGFFFFFIYIRLYLFFDMCTFDYLGAEQVCMIVASFNVLLD